MSHPRCLVFCHGRVSGVLRGIASSIAIGALMGVGAGHALGAESRPAPSWAEAKSLEELQLELVNLRFGMFIHFSPATYLDVPDQLRPDHAPPRQGKDGKVGTADDLSPSLVHPAKLDCGQWADAAKSAGMRFGVLTTKHHDGFCLWPSKYSDYTVAQGCKRDIVGEFADAFRSRGLKVGLYYSIRDRTAGIADQKHGGVSPAQVEFIKNQLTELLTHYGPILYIVFDGWGNNWHESPAFSDISYAEIWRHVKSLQPNCLVLNHSRLRGVSDALQIELAAHMALPAADWPAVGGNTMQERWFWRTYYPTNSLRSVDGITGTLRDFSRRSLVFQLNCAPNRDGLMDSNVVARLAEVGKAWTPPPPLETVPASWNDWPVPSSVHPFVGTNIALGKPARSLVNGEIIPAPGLTDGDPCTPAKGAGTNAWWEVDLGQSYQLRGLHLWNQAWLHSVMLERGFILVSDQPFSSNDPTALRGQPDVKTIAIAEAPGYPTPYSLGARGRYVRIASAVAQNLALGELEVFADPPATMGSEQEGNSAAVKSFMDYIQPMPIVGALSTNAWGATEVGPRDPKNGLEDPTMTQWNYWDGQIIKGKDGKYHMFASRWPQARGHGDWYNSKAVHAVSDALLGPYEDKGLLWPDNEGGKGHNVTALVLPDGRYAVVISETRPGDVFVADSLDGPWKYLGKMEVADNQFRHLGLKQNGNMSNVSIMVRPDGNFEIVPRSGAILISTNGVLGPYVVQGPRIYPGLPGMPQSNLGSLEDPVFWFSGGLYHVVVNNWKDRRAYHLTSADGIHDWKYRGVAFDPTTDFARYTDGTVNHWHKMERPGVVIENGHVVALTLASMDTPKETQKGNNGHGSKVVVLPVDGAGLDRDLQGATQ